MKLKLSLFLFFISLTGFSQNLVPNPSFEEYNELHCGNTVFPSDFNNASLYWITPTAATPELYSKLVDIGCGNHPLGETQQSSGYQEPRDGDFMVGLITYTERDQGVCHDYSEYVQVKLNAPLIKGETYHCGLYISLGDEREYASNNMGMLITESEVRTDTCQYLELNPQFNVNNIITEKDKWVFVNGSFQANNFGEYLTIGNFFSDESTDTKYIKDNPIFSSGIAYYFIDSVFVEQVNKLKIPNVFTPNNDEFNSTFFIAGLEESRWILTINNRWGQEVYQSKYYNNEWDGSGLNPGVYYYYFKHRYVDVEYKGTITILK